MTIQNLFGELADVANIKKNYEAAKENYRKFKILYFEFCARYEAMTPEDQAEFAEIKKEFDAGYKFFQPLFGEE